MKDALAMYDAILFEIDQYQSALFDVEEFNYWMPKAVDKWLGEQLKVYETTQTVTDKISCLVKTSAPSVLNPDNTTDVREFNLPEDYRHLVSCLIVLRYKEATASYAVAATRQAYTKRYTGDNIQVLMDNYYLKPFVSDSDVRVYHRVIGNKVSVLFESPTYLNPSIVIKQATVEYIMEPEAIELSEEFEVVVDTPFPEHANREIATLCAALFLENEGNQRLQSHAAINN